ncbi:oxidoreductase [Brevundimonas diminuta]|uniref:oxidoreductase n=1 Tax=Brevundimonas diminuta TaxID=293 RepID=UPI003D0346DB
MDVFYCLVHTPEAITPELCVLPGVTECEAVRGLNDVAREWPRLERIDLYRGNHEVRSFAPADLIPNRQARRLAA